MAEAKKPPMTLEDREPNEEQKRKMREQLGDYRASEAAKKAPTTKKEMGKVFKMGGAVGSASKRADGCAQRGKTKGRMI